MEIAVVIRELLNHKRWLAVGVVVSAFAAVVSVYRPSLAPPDLQPRALQYSSAFLQAFVDSPRSFVDDLTPSLGPLTERATVFANLMVSPGALDLVGQESGIPGGQIWAAGPVDPTQQREVIEPTATKRNYQVAGESRPYRIEFLADPNLPVINIYTQAPTSAQAVALATGSVRALSRYIENQQLQQHVPPSAQVTVRTIGPASAALVNGGITKKLAGLTFVAVFLAWCVLVLIAARFRANWRQSAVAFVLRPQGEDPGISEGPQPRNGKSSSHSWRTAAGPGNGRGGTAVLRSDRSE